MRMTVKLKLALAFATAMFRFGDDRMAFGIMNWSSLNARLDAVLQGPAQRMVESLRLSEELVEVGRAERDLILAGSKAQADGFEAELSRLRLDFVGRINALEASAATEYKPIWVATRTSFQQYTAIQDKNHRRRAPKTPGHRRPTCRWDPRKTHWPELRTLLQQAVEINQKRFNDAQSDAEREYEYQRGR